MRGVFFILLLLILPASANAQPFARWSAYIQEIPDTNEARFLASVEETLLLKWKSPVTGADQYPEVFDKSFHAAFYVVPLIPSEIDSIVRLKPYAKAPSRTQLIISWNMALDSFWVMGMTPAPWSDKYHTFAAPALIPANNYRNPFLKPGDSARYNSVMLKQTAGALHAQLTGSNRLELVRQLDSNYFGVLPHARLDNFMGKIIDRAGDLLGLKLYSDRALSNEINDVANALQKTEQAITPVESTAWVIQKYFPVKFLIFENWVPFSTGGPYLWTSKIGYRREVISMGIELSNGKQIWFNPQTLYSKLNLQSLSTSHEEVFRAERYDTIQILPD